MQVIQKCIIIIRYKISFKKQKENTKKIFWIPSHINITGNERADKLAKEAIVSPNALPCQVYSITDIKQIIKTKNSQYRAKGMESI